jgi:hypothetical protein
MRCPGINSTVKTFGTTAVPKPLPNTALSFAPNPAYGWKYSDIRRLTHSGCLTSMTRG